MYECWAIKKWLAENGNRSPLTNVVITNVLEPLKDTEEVFAVLIFFESKMLRDSLLLIQKGLCFISAQTKLI